jgi:hypothetical protein
MKKLFLLSVAAGISVATFAQRKANPAFTTNNTVTERAVSFGNNVMGKTTAVGDTFILPLFTSVDTFALYPVDIAYPLDSGYITGTDAYGDKGFAQRYDVKASDSTIKVIGVYYLFGGHVNPASTKTVNFNVWNMAPKTVSTIRPTIFNSGFPGASLASKTVNFTQLGVPAIDTATDTFKYSMFATPTAFLTRNFFVGYEVNYDWTAMGGDTIGLWHSRYGNRTAPVDSIYSTSDTTINNYNCTEYSDGTWHDNYTSNFGMFYKLYIRPIVIIGAAVNNGVSVTNTDLQFFGNYPNPAVNVTNIKFALTASADVAIQITDMSGRVVNTISKKGLSTGEHTIAVETANLAAGDYIYVINTSNGGGIASKFTVIK